MRILITGGLGFVGAHLTKRLRAVDHAVYIFDRRRESLPDYFRGDLTDYESLSRAFGQVHPHIVIHLAGMVSRMECEETPVLAVNTNVIGTYHVCNLSAQHNSRIIYGGSSEQYGTAMSGLITEETPFGDPTGVYSMSKRMGEDVVRYFARIRGLTATTVRFFMLYGPGEYPTEYRSALVRFVKKALHNEPIIVHASTERAWCYIDDAIDALEAIIFKSQTTPWNSWNIGREEETPTETLARMIIAMCNSKSQIRIIPPPPTVNPIKRADFEKMRWGFGWQATTSIEHGLEKVIHWLRHEEGKDGATTASDPVSSD